MKWLDVVKKHLKLNPGKSLRDVMPAVKKEYYGLVPTNLKNLENHANLENRANLNVEENK